MWVTESVVDVGVDAGARTVAVVVIADNAVDSAVRTVCYARVERMQQCVSRRSRSHS